MVSIIYVLIFAGSAFAQRDYCNPSPCGKNTECELQNGRPVCGCKPTYIGNPVSKDGCRHECEKDDECSQNQGCVSFRCKDPCKVQGACGDYASCQVVDHQAICSCPNDYGGDAYTKCIPECTSQAECPNHLACIGYHCGNPCTESSPCGRNTRCQVEGHTAVCLCRQGYYGNPVSGCRPS